MRCGSVQPFSVRTRPGRWPGALGKRWIGGSLEPKGAVHVDVGAVAALRRGKSLLPAGVLRVEGAFARGDAVLIRGPEGAEVGRGLIAYDKEDAERLVGQNSEKIEAILGYRGRSEMIHRDDLVMGGE
jgi:glutamate 5-kinase